MMSLTASAQTSIYTTDRSEPVMFGIREIEKALQKKGKVHKLIYQDDGQNADIVLSLQETTLVEGGFRIERNAESIRVAADRRRKKSDGYQK
jgi:hypothetical protein